MVGVVEDGEEGAVVVVVRRLSGAGAMFAPVKPTRPYSSSSATLRRSACERASKTSSTFTTRCHT